jgi:predicted metal-dependent hydrolase
MNAPVDRDSLAHPSSPRPIAPLPITVRDRRFGRDAAPSRWWLNGDPVATAWHNALSATFPRGEAMFIESVKAFREGVPPRLAEEIRAFVKQEVNHTREHLAFNRAAEAAGYDFSRIDARTERLIADVYAKPPSVWLGVTMALEHFTAMFAHEFLSNPEHFHGGDEAQADLWRWHAVEEIEHKAVAYDTWSHATAHWSRWRRWQVKSLLMLLTTGRFVRHRSGDALDLLAQDGITGLKARARLAWYLVGSPGILRRVLPHWLAYFLPGFHPWKLDDRALIAGYDAPGTAPEAAPAN